MARTYPAVKSTQFHPFPGTRNQFHIILDGVSRMFWMTANLGADSQSAMPWWKDVRFDRYRTRTGGGSLEREGGGYDRRFLMPMYGVDGLNWFQADALRWRPGCACPTTTPRRWWMDRTFHRVRSFRSLALNLVPQP